MKTGDKVYAKSRFMEGKGTILSTVKCNFYPIQVEMDQGDDDGHMIYRFSYGEVELVNS